MEIARAWRHGFVRAETIAAFAGTPFEAIAKMDRAELVLGEVEAPRARADAFTERHQGFREATGLIGGLTQEVVRQSKGGLPTDARKP